MASGPRLVGESRAVDFSTLWMVTRRLRWLVIVVVLMAGCGDGGDQADRQPKLEGTPAAIVGAAVEELGVRTARLGSEAANRELMTGVLGRRGIPADEARCYMDSIIAAAFPDFGELTVFEITTFTTRTDKRATEEQRLAAQACWSDESRKRRQAGELAPDLDVELVRRVGLQVLRISAQEIGLTPEEAGCFAQERYGTLTPDQIRAGLRSEENLKLPTSEDAVKACVDPERVEELAPELGRRIVVQREKERVDRQRTDASINEELRKLMTTTVP